MSEWAKLSGGVCEAGVRRLGGRDAVAAASLAAAYAPDGGGAAGASTMVIALFDPEIGSAWRASRAAGDVAVDVLGMHLLICPSRFGQRSNG